MIKMLNLFLLFHRYLRLKYFFQSFLSLLYKLSKLSWSSSLVILSSVISTLSLDLSSEFSTLVIIFSNYIISICLFFITSLSSLRFSFFIHSREFYLIEAFVWSSFKIFVWEFQYVIHLDMSGTSVALLIQVVVFLVLGMTSDFFIMFWIF